MSLWVSSNPSVATQVHRSRAAWWALYTPVVLLTLMMVALAAITVDEVFSATFVLLVAGVVMVLRQPAVGIYLIAFFGLIGDAQISPWYPGVKNLSSGESLLYVGNAVSVSPIEIILVASVGGWLLRALSSRRSAIRRGALWRPLLVFTSFVIYGLMFGLITGGDPTAALWEVRGLLYLPVIYLLAQNVFTSVAHYRYAFLAIAVAVLIDSLMAMRYLTALGPAQRDTIDSLGEHTASLHLNAIFVLIFAARLFRGSSWQLRAILPLLALPTVFIYIEGQRRSAVAALIVAAVLLAAILFTLNRRKFWKIVPIVSLIFMGYVGAFWNSASALGFPAQAVKEIVAPNQISQEDADSNAYRKIENTDIIATMHSKPLTGIGFGHPFLRPIPLPSISNFLLAPYMPHNSLLWVWLKTGPLGFAALLYLFTRAVSVGVRDMRLRASPDAAALSLAAVIFVAMYAIFAFVDIAWDAQSMVILGLALATIGSDECRALRSGAEASSGPPARKPRTRKPPPTARELPKAREPLPSRAVAPARAEAGV